MEAFLMAYIVLYCLVLALIRLQLIKITKNQELNFLKKVSKSVLSLITPYPKDDDQKPVDFNGETVHFTCQIVKI